MVGLDKFFTKIQKKCRITLNRLRFLVCLLLLAQAMQALHQTGIESIGMSE
jgi:hypothetical protein